MRGRETDGLTALLRRRPFVDDFLGSFVAVIALEDGNSEGRVGANRVGETFDRP